VKEVKTRRRREDKDNEVRQRKHTCDREENGLKLYQQTKNEEGEERGAGGSVYIFTIFSNSLLSWR